MPRRECFLPAFPAAFTQRRRQIFFSSGLHNPQLHTIGKRDHRSIEFAAHTHLSAAFTKGIELALPNALISYDRFHVVALAGEAMDEVRTAEWKQEAALVEQELGHLTPAERRSILWGMRRNPNTWSQTQVEAMHWLQRANLKSARAWRLKMGLREVFTKARHHNDAEQAATNLGVRSCLLP